MQSPPCSSLRVITKSLQFVGLHTSSTTMSCFLFQYKEKHVGEEDLELFKGIFEGTL